MPHLITLESTGTQSWGTIRALAWDQHHTQSSADDHQAQGSSFTEDPTKEAHYQWPHENGWSVYLQWIETKPQESIIESKVNNLRIQVDSVEH